MKKLTPTFFDSLAIAGAERIHSQTIAWIFSLSNGVLSDESKSNALCRLFGLNTNQIFTNIKAYTEIDKIDILIDSDNYQFAIENKLKSSEHSEQTTRYEIPSKLRSPDKPVEYAFLTLTNEKARNQNWHNLTFTELKDSLQQLDDIKDEKARIFVAEYIDTLENLTSVFNRFLANPSDFPNVFKDGGKKKHEKQNQEIDFLEYVRLNQLETIFQKAFLRELTKGFPYSVEISETRGTALIQIPVNAFFRNDVKFYLGFQLQGSTVKINLQTDDYGNSAKDQIDRRLSESFKNTFLNQNGYNKFNPPKSKAYLSVSKKLGKEIYEIETGNLRELINGEITAIKEKSADFYKRLAE